MAVKWNIENISLRDVGSADSVEITHMLISAYDSYGSGDNVKSHREFISWVPKNPIYYADSGTAKAVAQTAAFDNWLEVDSDHTSWMERVEWSVRTKIWQADYTGGTDSYTISRVVQLTDSAEVVNPLGL